MRYFRAVSLYLPPMAMAVFIFALSSRPIVIGQLPFPQADKLAHFFIFGILTCLVYRAWSEGFNKGRPVNIFTISAILSVIYGAADEFHQRFVAGRQCEAADLMADALGAIVFASLCIYVQKKKIAHNSTRNDPCGKINA